MIFFLFFILLLLCVFNFVIWCPFLYFVVLFPFCWQSNVNFMLLKVVYRLEIQLILLKRGGGAGKGKAVSFWGMCGYIQRKENHTRWESKCTCTLYDDDISLCGVLIPLKKFVMTKLKEILIKTLSKNYTFLFP